MHIKTIAIGKINAAPYNPRVDLRPGDAEYEKLRRSIGEFGLVEPLVWNRRTGNLVGGHQRFKVLLEEGITHAEVSVVDLPPERERALNLALNRISGEWDEEKLARLLDELSRTPGLDLALTGFDPPEIDELLASLDLGNSGGPEAFDLDAELGYKGPVVTKPGDLIELGRHRLLCGDCTDPRDVRRLVASGGGRSGGRAALFATDPPYLVGYDGTNHPRKGPLPRKGRMGSGARRLERMKEAGEDYDALASSMHEPPLSTRGVRRSPDAGRRAPRGGNKDWSDSYGVTWDDADANSDLYERFVRVAIDEAILPGAAWYCWHASRRHAMLEAVWRRAGVLPHCQIIWVKNRPVLTRTWYAWRHEPCLMGWMKGRKPARVEPAVRSTVWEFDTIPTGPARPDHPTPKPLELFEIPMRQHTRPGEVVYEPFAGSGTQLIAAERLGRRCLALEISPRYCDVIVRRWLASPRNGPLNDRDGSLRTLIERYRRKDEPRGAATKGRGLAGGRR